MAKQIVTMFVGDANIKLVTAKGDKVQAWASMRLDPGLVSQGVILDEDKVASQLRELIELEGIKTNNLSVALSGINSLYRLLTLPEVPEVMLDEAIKREARRALPVDLDELYLSYQLLPAPIGERHIFLVAFPRNAADSLLRTLRKAGLEPNLIDLAPLATCRIANEPRAIILYAELDYLDIIVMVDRIPQQIRSLSLPGESESLDERLPTIAEELSRTIAFYNSSHLEKPLDSTVPILVSGDLARLPENLKSLVGRLDFSASVLPLPVKYTEDFPSADFAINLGLVLKESLPKEAEANYSLINLNVMPETYIPKHVSVFKVRASIGIIAGIGILGYMFYLFYGASAYNAVLRSEQTLIEQRSIEQTREIETLKEQIEGLEPRFNEQEKVQSAEVQAQIDSVEEEIGTVQPQVDELESQAEQLQATLAAFDDTLASLNKGREQVHIDMREIVDDLQLQVDLTVVNHEAAGSAVISGISSDESRIFDYARRLRDSGRFSEVLISEIAREFKEIEEEEVEQFRFEILLIYRG